MTIALWLFVLAVSSDTHTDLRDIGAVSSIIPKANIHGLEQGQLHFLLSDNGIVAAGFNYPYTTTYRVPSFTRSHHEGITTVGESHEPVKFHICTTSQAKYIKWGRSWTGGGERARPLYVVDEHTVIAFGNTGPLKGGGSCQGVGIVYLDRRGETSPNKFFLFSTSRTRVYTPWKVYSAPKGWHVIASYVDKAKPDTHVLQVFNLTESGLKAVSRSDKSNPHTALHGLTFPAGSSVGDPELPPPLDLDPASKRVVYYVNRSAYHEYDLVGRKLARHELPKGYQNAVPQYVGGKLYLTTHDGRDIEWDATKWTLLEMSLDRQRIVRNLGPYRIRGANPKGTIWLVEGPKKGELRMFTLQSKE